MTIKPQNFEEKLVWYYIIGTYGWYFLGAQFVVGPALAWVLILYLGKKLWNQTESTPTEGKVTIPFSVWVWIVSMLIIEVTILVSHIDFDLGTIRTIFSTINWSRHHALMALFPLIGCLNIRPQLVYRAICIVALQSLVFIAVAYVASLLKFPAETLYVSPFRVAGSNPSLYSVQLYYLENKSQVRMLLFAPWAPALGLIANVYFFLAYQESNRKWRLIGMIGSVAMIVVSISRAAWVCFPVTLFLTLFLVTFTQPITQVTAGLVSFLTGIFGPQLIDWFSTSRESFDNARLASSRLRKVLAEIGIYRWWNEAPIWGHGIQDLGPQVVERMPIGSHHTWVGLLFTYGLVGFIAQATPLLWSFLDLLIKAQKSKAARAGLSTILVLFIMSFAENIEYLAYLYWPGLLIMGIAFKEVVYDFKKSVVSIG